MNINIYPYISLKSSDVYVSMETNYKIIRMVFLIASRKKPFPLEKCMRDETIVRKLARKEEKAKKRRERRYIRVVEIGRRLGWPKEVDQASSSFSNDL